jgi:DNA modification methylase
MEIKSRSIDQLITDPLNPHTHSRPQVRQIARSIKKFGFNVPILIDSTGKVLAGHGRFLAAQQLGMTHVPTIMIEHLTEAQARAFMIADNKLCENAEWNVEILGEQFRQLAELELDFELEITGFTTGEIDVLIDGIEAGATRNRDAADELPEVGVAVTRPCDTWLLGGNRLLCSDALQVSSYATLLKDEQAAMAITDPPYNVPIDGNVSGFGAHRHREFAMASGEMSPDEFIDFLAAAMTNITKSTVPGAIHYYFMDWRHSLEILEAARATRLRQLNLCVWSKDTAGMGSLYRSQHELVFVFKNGLERHRNNVELGRYGRNRTNIWNYPGAIGLRSSDEGNLIAMHATPKPVVMIADAIMDVSARGDIVLDPFLGSGTSIIASERTGRRCYGIEIDPLYCDAIVRRWQTFTRDCAVRAADGRAFNEIEEEVKNGSVE